MKKYYGSKKFYLLAGIALANLVNVGIIHANDVSRPLVTDSVASPVTINQQNTTSRQTGLSEQAMSTNLVSESQRTGSKDLVSNQDSQVPSTTSQDVKTVPPTNPITLVKKTDQTEVKTAAVQDTVLSYSGHVQDIGWQAPVTDGLVSGTTGQAKRLEAIKINMSTPYTGAITYNSSVINSGWQKAVSTGQISGTTGQSKAIEAIQINLTGDLALKYDIYYRTHIASYGWLSWAKNGAFAGSTGLSKQLEAFEIFLITKGAETSLDQNKAFIQMVKPSLTYQTHVQTIGWGPLVAEGQLAGTTGQSKRIEGLIVNLSSNEFGNLQYRSHVQGIGWQNYVTSGSMSGTNGQSRRLEALQLQLTGSLAQKYSVKYRVHVQDIGWQAWVYDNAIAGTTGQSKRLEAIEIVLVDKIATPIGLSASQGNYAVVNNIIYLDAGHGGYDSGAAYFNQYEKTLNLQMQNRIKAKLEAAGYKVITTRTSDTYVDLIPRSENANASLSDLFVSLHFNASTSSYANGIESYYYEYYPEYPSAINELYHNDPERLSRSAFLAQAIQSAAVKNTGAKDNGVLRNTFAVLRETTAPAVLLELGYMSNATEFQKITTAAYQEKLATGVVSGILAYYKHYTV
ncbi:N-acetylmuramoyl-L-alanine amidase [Streptococcus pseudoporcinus]|uniref:N-acetylmuramoyl-L-alanine amidase n=1 Tax=Streptococcus pseudoporcinus LQ 940-04 TaxID=875093 RepID=G5K6T5_9STRE|nr:N-acetylmuramoyl-L-alanine amidase [Streptococcus pseudoporcinus]EFR44150.1 N-acetylmuramoyl-L-alanine amidase [Streptococcus pseudoporcinus SPIN 20026]EHI65942.1 N-acetylmuramoyl-L-alanine amidase [Streptococcus pseudoporcinus LQ 940-04]VEF94634.1 N-acetylmuramoyl-L-alanine amidase [Streptococcus pseudoporcinus]